MNREDNKRPGMEHDTPDWLKSMKKEGSGYKVPEDYFRSFPDRLMDRIASEKGADRPSTGHQQKMAIRRLAYWATAAAASLLFMVYLWRGLAPAEEQFGNTEYALASIEPDEALDYMMDHAGSYEWSELVEFGLVDVETQQTSSWMEEMTTDELIEELDDDLLLELL